MKFKRLVLLLLLLILPWNFVLFASAEDISCATVKFDNETKTYTSFNKAWNEAVNAADSGKDVVFILEKNWIANSNGSLGDGSGFKYGAIYYSKNKNITIDLNGYCIDRKLYTPKNYGAVIYVASQLTIIDSRSDNYSYSKLVKGGIITGGASTERGGGIYVYDRATLNFNGGTILNCVSTENGGAIYVVGLSATLNVNGGSFYGNRTYDANGECCGGAIFSLDSTVNIKNSVFEGNYCEDDGGAIYADGGNLKILDSKFYYNYSRENAGAIYLYNKTNTSIDKCSFVNNKSSEDGGAVYIDANEGTHITNCNMYYNTSNERGGAIFINGNKTFINGGEYKYNSASEYGGGIYVDSMYDINALGKLVIIDNTVNEKKSNLCLQNGNLSTAYLYCGGLYDGSHISIGSTDKSSRLAIVDIDKYQLVSYIFFDEGFSMDSVSQYTKDINKNEISAEGSALGSGNIILIVCLTVFVIVILSAVFVVTKRKKKGDAKDDN